MTTEPDWSRRAGDRRDAYATARLPDACSTEPPGRGSPRVHSSLRVNSGENESEQPLRRVSLLTPLRVRHEVVQLGTLMRNADSNTV